MSSKLLIRNVSKPPIVGRMKKSVLVKPVISSKPKITSKPKPKERKRENKKDIDETANYIIQFEGTYDNPEDVLPRKELSVKKSKNASRKEKNTREVSMYKKLTQHRQIYLRPETFTGAIEREERMEEVFDFEENKLKLEKVELPYAMIHFLMEATTNAADNADSTRRADIKLLPKKHASKLKKIGKLRTWFTDKRVKVRNNGLPVPVIPSDNLSGNLVPISVFGELNSGNNYDDDEYIRTGSGRNGVGIKLPAIFSTYFRIRIGDPINGQEFDCIWVGNMTEIAYLNVSPGYERSSDGKSYAKDKKGEWICSPGKKYTGEPYVEVEYELDFERFDYKKYPKEAFGIFAQRVLFLGMSSKIVVEINDIEYDVRNIRNFAKLRFDEESCKSAVIHYDWPKSGRGKNKTTDVPERFENMTKASLEKAITNPETPDEIPVVELLALDTPDNGVILSSVNGQCTPEGGVHVTEALRSVSSIILEEINSTIKNIKQKKRKSKVSTTKPDVKINTLTVDSVRKHVSLVVNCRLQDTSYSTQTKVRLSKPKPKIDIPKETLNKVSKWRLVEMLYDEMQNKITKAMKKTDGKKNRFITPSKGEDANEAGGSRSSECIIYWCEGDSATSYPKERISSSPGGKDLGGYFPGKGKMINICNATPNQLINNDDIIRLKQFTGLYEGIDVSDPKSKAKLRYGFICIATDADKDGQHILMLRINYIYRRFPSLISEGMVGFLETPFARALKGRNKQEKVLEVFRDEGELEKWLDENSDWFEVGKKGHWIKYYKGLASSRNRDIEDDIKTAPMIVVVYDDLSPHSLDIAFKKENADKRKLWIQKWRGSTGFDIKMTPISDCEGWYEKEITDLCNKNLVEYSKETYFRALPSEYDGDKESQRKSRTTGLKRWNHGNGNAGSTKTSRIAMTSAQETLYQHGESCLVDIYARASQDFVGSNNMAFYTPEGQLGSRHQGGADGGDARYTEIGCSEWVKYVYCKDFLKVIKLRESEGSNIEPFWIPAAIPMHIVNGFRGIATAYSTYSPNHNPYDVIEWLIARNKGTLNPEPVHPWYKGFTGKIEVVNVDYSVKAKSKTTFSKNSKGKLVSKTVNTSAVSSDKMLKIKNDEKEQDYESDIEDYLSEDEDDYEKKTEEEKDIEKQRTITKVKNSSPQIKTYGNFTQDGTTVRITELPIGVWTYTYRKYLEKRRAMGDFTSIRDKSKTDTVDFIIEGFTGEATYANLKLIKRNGMGNMVLIDNEGFPTKYKNTQEVMQRYYDVMIVMFTDLKEFNINEIKEQIHDIDQRYLFIKSHNDEKLIIKKREDSNVYSQMDKLGIEHKYYDIVKAREFSDTRLNELDKSRAKLVEKMELMIKTTPEEMWIEILEKLKVQLKKMKICIPTLQSIKNRKFQGIKLDGTRVFDKPVVPEKKKISVKISPKAKSTDKKIPVIKNRSTKIATKIKPRTVKLLKRPKS